MTNTSHMFKRALILSSATTALAIGCGVRQAGPKVVHNVGTIPITLKNASAIPVCGATLAKVSAPADDRDHLVCAPGGIQFGNGAGVRRCVSPCLAPGEQRSFSVAPANYQISGSDEQSSISLMAFHVVKGPTEFVFGGKPTPGARSADGKLLVGVRSDTANETLAYGGAPSEPSGPCTADGAQRRNLRCCGGYEYFDDKRNMTICSNGQTP